MGGGVFKGVCPTARLMTEADPRIALMQKWSQENPALMAQAGLSTLASTAEDAHFLAGGPNQERLKLLKLAGVDTTAHGHPQSGHPIQGPKKGKSHKKKGGGSAHGSGAHVTVNGVHLIVGGHESVHQQPTKHKKKNPFMGVEVQKLRETYSHAQTQYVKAVNDTITAIDSTMTKTPHTVSQAFMIAFTPLKQYKKGLTSHTYETTYAKIEATLAAYKAIKPDLKYTLHLPHTIPTDTTAGTASLLSKLINATIALLRVYTQVPAERTAFGMYEFRAELYKMANAKANCMEINAALIHEHNKLLMRHPSSTTPLHHTHDPRNPQKYYPSTGIRESAEHAFDNTFSMAQPFVP